MQAGRTYAEACYAVEESGRGVVNNSFVRARGHCADRRVNNSEKDCRQETHLNGCP